MRILNLFSGKSPRDHDQKGDVYLQAGMPGKAKIEYEAARAKLEKISTDDSDFTNRLAHKIHQCKEALALEHKQSADAFWEAGYYEDAREYYDLAKDLTEDSDLKAAIEACLQEIEHDAFKKEPLEISDVLRPVAKDSGPADREHSDEYFAALDDPEPSIFREDGDAPGLLQAEGADIEVDYRWPYLAHATMEPMSCTALFTGDELEVWAGSQAISVASGMRG